MSTSTGRCLLAAVSSAGMLISGAVSASASSDDDGHGRGDRYGTVNVCQEVRDHDGRSDKGRRDRHRDSFRGTYSVSDSRGGYWKVYLQGKYDCDEVRVHRGRVNVRIDDQPEHTRLRSRYSQSVYVDGGGYARVTFRYDARHGHSIASSRAA
jgi:hypothetical protein